MHSLLTEPQRDAASLVLDCEATVGICFSCEDNHTVHCGAAANYGGEMSSTCIAGKKFAMI